MRVRAMGCEIAVAGDADGVRELFEADDRRFTRFADDSELLRVNRAHGSTLVSERFAHALSAALSAARLTDGLVDPTLLDALEGAGYDRDFPALLDRGPTRAGARGRWREVRLHGRLLTLPPGVRLDLNGVVKAIAVDDVLARVGFGWVSAGGDLATTRPVEVALPSGGAIRLERGALATSSSATRRWVRGGRWQHHLIDPRTGRPAESPWQQVTVCGATCLMADIAAKAAFLMGADGPDWLDKRAMAGRFVRTDGSIELNGAWRATSQEPACT
jgi:thiamine biosynthesis lipoprotein